MRVFILLLILIGVGFAIFLYPMIYKEKICYDNTATAIDAINYSVVSQDVSKETVCSKRGIVLMDLEDCLNTATASSNIALYANSFITRAVYIIRPFTVSLEKLKADHNSDCGDYINYQLN